jgi:acyl-coenzyme A synthetase/AMP-(fatty) acid ligase
MTGRGTGTGASPAALSRRRDNSKRDCLLPPLPPPPVARAANPRRRHRALKVESYWRRPDADARALHDGWYFTGDAGYFDAEGDLFVTGRVDDMIISGGENVSPAIESVLSLHPAVAEVAVVGPPDERWGQYLPT